LLVPRLRIGGVLLHFPHASSYYIQNLKIQTLPIQNTIRAHKKAKTSILFNIIWIFYAVRMFFNVTWEWKNPVFIDKVSVPVIHTSST